MPGRARVEVKGLDRLVTTMRRAGHDLDDLKTANNRAGEIVAVAGRAAAPRDTNRLAASIKSRRQARRARVVAGGGKIRYARFQEFGSSKNPARHYLYGALERKRPEVVDVYLRDVVKIMATVRGA